MATRSTPQPRGRRRILIILLIAAIGLLIVAQFILVASARQGYREEIGNNFSQRADNAQEVLVSHIEGLSAQVANLTTLPQIRDLVRQANEQDLKPTSKRLRRFRSTETSRRWRTSGGQ